MQATISLFTGLRSELRGFSLVRETVKLAARALVHRRTTKAWLNLLNSDPLYAQLQQAYPRLVNKIYRNYMSARFGCSARFDAIQTHYQTVMAQGLAPLVLRAAVSPVEMCRLQTKEGVYRVELGAGTLLVREGELIFRLMHEDTLVYSVACSFVRDGFQTMLGVGCLQGAAGEAAQDGVRDATRALHGMRPKNLLMRVVRQFGRDHGCLHMLLVSNANRVVTKSMRKGRVHADYDGLWRELGAVERADGDFELRCEHLPELDLSAIASKKRSEAKKRHEMLVHGLADIAEQVERSRRALTPLRLVTAPLAVSVDELQLRKSA